MTDAKAKAGMCLLPSTMWEETKNVRSPFLSITRYLCVEEPLSPKTMKAGFL